MVKHVFKCGCTRDPKEAVKDHKTGRMVCPEHKAYIDYSVYTCEKCGKSFIGRFSNKQGPWCHDCKRSKTLEYSREYSKQYNIQHTKPKRRGRKDNAGTISTDYGLKTGTKPDCGFYSLCLIDTAFSFERNAVIPCKKCKIYVPVKNVLKAENYVRTSDICTSNVTELPISPEVRRIGRR